MLVRLEALQDRLKRRGHRNDCPKPWEDPTLHGCGEASYLYWLAGDRIDHTLSRMAKEKDLSAVLRDLLMVLQVLKRVLDAYHKETGDLDEAIGLVHQLWMEVLT